MLSKFNGPKSRVVTVGIRAVFLTPYLALSHKVDASNSSKHFKKLFLLFDWIAYPLYIIIDTMPKTRAQQIKMDREATKAFMSSNPPSFDGSDLKKLQGWMHKVKIGSITCHNEEHLQVNFASTLLDG